jgi:hypothetical protein
LIVWVIAGLLGLATGLRIGWALVNKQSVVSAAMMLALGSLGVMAALNWAPLTLLIDAAFDWPNISIALSQVALIVCAAGSCVMITSAASTMKPAVMRRLVWASYFIAGAIAAVSLALFFAGGRQTEMSTEEYLRHYLGSHTSLPWLLPLLFVVFTLTVVAVVVVRNSSQSRRGRALFVFTVGIVLIVVAIGVFSMHAVDSRELVGIRPAVVLLEFAMLIVATGALLPTIEDWFGARLELRAINPLFSELARRQPEVGVGVRPRGPLTFRVAERMSLISDALFLEATQAADEQSGVSVAVGDAVMPGPGTREQTHVMAQADPRAVPPIDQAQAIAAWVLGTREGNPTRRFPGLGWLRQPENYSDREWILAIAQQYRRLDRVQRTQTPDHT